MYASSSHKTCHIKLYIAHKKQHNYLTQTYPCIRSSKITFINTFLVNKKKVEPFATSTYPKGNVAHDILGPHWTMLGISLQMQVDLMGHLGILTLRELCTPYLKLACFVLYLIIINTFFKNNTHIL